MKLTVSRLADAVGVGVETIRFYQRRGLVKLPAKGNGYREYSDGDVARIRFIKRAQGIGFTLSEIADLIQLEQDADARCGDFQQRADEKVRMIDERIADLQRMRTELAELAAGCPSTQPLSDCRLMSCLSHTC